MQILARDLVECRAMTEILRPEGVWFCPGQQCTRQEADDFLKFLHRWAAGKQTK